MNAWLRTRAIVVVLWTSAVSAHDGPPFPIISDSAAGPYVVSIWTDPDTTEDGSAGGQFWVRVHRSGDGGLPPETRATVRVRPLDRAGTEGSASADPVRGDVSNQFVALVLDHEGRFAVTVTVNGPLGMATIDSAVDATYDLRPAPYLLVIYLVPFVAVGLLWVRLIARRRRSHPNARGAS
jgi:hypothetical protein